MLRTARDTSAKKKLLLFIHGLGGGPDDAASAKYWGEFARLAVSDVDLAKIYDVRFFSYASSRIVGFPSTPVPISAERLRSRLALEWRHFDQVDIIAHSQGGLVTRRYIADCILRKDSVRIGRAIFYDTPNMGSSIGKITEIPGVSRAASQEAVDLSPGSAMLQTLLRDEEASGAHLAVPIRFAVAGRPGIVDRPSAWGIGHPADYIVISDCNHSTIIAPKDANDPIFIAAKSWLVEATARSGDDPRTLHEQPRLSGKQFTEASGADALISRFAYWRRTTPFAGRQAELAQLDEFLDDPSRRFAWKILCGVGGMGKSRLALELVLRARRDHWRAGFLDSLKDGEYWARWQPSRPTLLVVDYAAKTPEPVGEMLKALAERSPSEALRKPVRLLLIERDPADPRLETMVAAARRTAGGNSRRPDLVLHPGDVRHIFEYVLGRSGDVATCERALTEIDPEQRRPLFAFLIADAVKRERNVRGWDRDALLNDVISRERTYFWWPKATSLGLSKQDAQAAERALVLATMVGGLPISLFQSASDDLLPSWNPFAHSQLFFEMTGKPVETAVPALEPDIVGEYFVLERLSALSRLRMVSGTTAAAALVARAWAISSVGTAQFFDRLTQDFVVQALATELLPLRPPIGRDAREPWMELARNLTDTWGSQGATRGHAVTVYEELKALAESHPQEQKIRQLQAEALVNLTSGTGNDPVTWAQGLQFYEELKALAEAHPQLEKLYELQAWAVFNLTRPSGGLGATQAQISVLYEELKVLAAAHPQVERIRAQAAVNLTAKLDTTDSAARAWALQLYEELKALAAAYPQKEELRERQANAAYNLIHNLGRDSATRVRALELYEELKALAAGHPEEKLIRSIVAKCAFRLILCWVYDPATRIQTLKLYEELKALAAAHSQDNEIRELQTKAVPFLIHYLVSDFVWRNRALELYEELKELTAAYPHGKEIRELQASVASELISCLGTDTATRTRALQLYEELKALAAAHPEEKVLRLEQARAAANLASSLSVDPEKRAQALQLYDELKAVAAAPTQDKDIRELQANAVVNLTYHLGIDPAKRARAVELYEELKALAAAHPGEKVLRLEQAKSALNMTYGQGADRATLARAMKIYEEVKALAATHPEEIEIREALTEVIVNLTYRLGNDPTARVWAQELHEELIVLAAVHPLQKEIREWLAIATRDSCGGR